MQDSKFLEYTGGRARFPAKFLGGIPTKGSSEYHVMSL